MGIYQSIPLAIPMRYLILFFYILLFVSCKKAVKPLESFGPVPTTAQWEWQNMEMNMFIHFNINTFTNSEWGSGAESPNTFNPTGLDTRQWASIAKEAGMKGIIITAKHHDGFCLWPSAYTEHSVKNSPWKGGNGDLLSELAQSCREYGLKFGVYLSPWDRNHPEYGRPEYIHYFRNQMDELLSNYGDVFEFWIDGANGGTGYYGGANEERKIDRMTYYQWEKTFELAFNKNPNLIIFSDGGPGCRWVGNEEGWASPTNWSLLRGKDVYPGYAGYKELPVGHPDGDAWIPAEVDVSIRPGWYYHPYEDHKVKTVEQLVNMYYESVGRNGLWLLNFPVDKRGLIHPIDSANILEAMKIVRRDLRHDLAKNATVSASSFRNSAEKYAPNQLTDDNPDTYWTTDDSIKTASIILEWPDELSFNRVMLQEDIRLGQRIEEFSIEVLNNGNWEEIQSQTTIGYKRILRFETVQSNSLRIHFKKCRANPVISNLQVFNAPMLLVPPVYSRSKDGEITLSTTDKGIVMYYTLDGSLPTPNSTKYESGIATHKPVHLRVVAMDTVSQISTEVISWQVDIPKKDFKVVSTSSGDIDVAQKIVDEDPSTWWETPAHRDQEEVTVDLGKHYEVRGITYLPTQKRYPSGFIQSYEVYTSLDGINFLLGASGEFGNLQNNPVEQQVEFPAIKARFLKIKSLKPVEGHSTAGFAEIGVLTQN